MSDGVHLLVVSSTPKNDENKLRPIILVPGWFSQPTGWIEVTKTISEFTKLIYIETREKNSSILERTKSTQMGIERMSIDIQSLKDNLELNFQESICVGSSLGGSALLHLLSESNSKPFLTVLISPNPDFKLPPILGRLLLSMPLFMIKLVKKYVKWHVLTFKIDRKSNPEQAEKYITTFDAADPWKVRTSARHVTKFKAWEFLPKLDANVIIAGATTDKIHESDRNITVGKLIKNSRYIDFWTNKALHSDEFGKFLAKLAADEIIDELDIIENM
ncbi:MAG: hypothetical protein GPJ54_09250 [Candidatus Heimdallarchaeota archaeon]|nr:hypothetical protein [Candidatus Heimdallarchaeota archaeon]